MRVHNEPTEQSSVGFYSDRKAFPSFLYPSESLMSKISTERVYRN